MNKASTGAPVPERPRICRIDIEEEICKSLTSSGFNARGHIQHGESLGEWETRPTTLLGATPSGVKQESDLKKLR